MQANGWMKPVKGFVGGKARECPRDSEFDIDGTQDPSLIARGGFLADGTFAELAGGIG